MTSIANIIIEEDRWLCEKDLFSWQENFNKLLEKTASIKGNKSFEVNLLLTDASGITQLNKEFRGKNAPTNVLSFPQYENACTIDTIIGDGRIFIGDIAMSFEIIMAESKEFSVSFQDRSSHLFVHGVLHLLGFDHEAAEQEKEMENLEINILDSFGIKNPYIV